MSKKRTRDKIISQTTSKVIIKWDRLEEVLTPEEKETIQKLIDKVIVYDKSL